MSIINKIDEAVAKNKPMVRNKLKKLDTTIDEFLDLLEDKALKIEDNPMFQQQVLQLLADTTKEHGEFMMALKRVSQALDSKSQKLGAIKPVGKQANPYGGPNPEPIGPNMGAQPTDQPSTAGDVGGDGANDIEEMRGLNEAVDLVKRGKSIAQVLVSFTKDLERAVGDLQGRDLVMGAKSFEKIKSAQQIYIVELSKILKSLGR
jgi:hypothetical protein